MDKILRVILALVLCVALLAGCGGPGDSPQSQTSDSGLQLAEATASRNTDGYAPFVGVQGVTDTAIYVGNTAPATGDFAAVGVPFNAGMQAAFKVYNDAGGFDGRKVELVHYDDGFDGARGLACTRKLVEDDRVFAIVGHFGTNTVSATLGYLKEMGVPMVYAATGVDALYQEDAAGNDKVIYPVQPIYSAEGRVLLARALAPAENGMGLGAAKVGVIATTDDAGTGLASGVRMQAEALGVGVAYQEVDASAADYSVEVGALRGAGCDVVIACMNQAPLATLMASMRDAGYDADVITSYVNASASTLGPLVESGCVTEGRRIYSTAWLDTSTEKGVANHVSFAANMAAWELENGGSGGDYMLNSYAMAGYVAGSLFVQALEALHDRGLEPDWRNFNDVMESVDFKLPMSGEISYRDGARRGLTSLALSAVSLEIGDSGYYELQVVGPIDSLENVLATIG